MSKLPESRPRPPDELEDVLHEARRLAEQGQLEKAAGWLKAAVRRSPGDVDGFLEIALTLRRSKRHAEALAVYEAIEEIRPDNAALLLLKGDELNELERLDEALTAFRRSAELTPDSSDAHASVSLVLRRQGQLEDALAAIQKALSLNPDKGDHHYHLGRVYFDLHRLEDAVPAFARALTLMPDHWGARYWLGVTYVRLEEFAEAEPLLKAITEHNPDYPGGHFYLAFCFDEMGRTEEAIASYRRVLELDPRDSRSHYLVGCLLAARGDRAEALVEQAILDELDPDLAGELDETLRYCDAMDRLRDPSSVYLIERRLEGTSSLEIFAARDAASAREFLMLRRVHKPNYKVVVRTNDQGTWIGTPGLIRLENLLPFQSHLRTAKISGRCVRLISAEQSLSSCIMADVACGQCGGVWTDGLRPGLPTVVRCPECQTPNRVEPPQE